MTAQLQISSRLRAGRIAAGFKSLRGFAAKHDIPFSTYSQHESGKRQMDDATLAYYCKHLGINLEWLTTGKGEVFKNNADPRKKLSSKDLAFISEMNKLTGTVTAIAEGINQPVLVEVLENLIEYHQSQKSKISMKKIVENAVALYSDVISNSESAEMRKRLLKSALNAYKQFD